MKSEMSLTYPRFSSASDSLYETPIDFHGTFELDLVKEIRQIRTMEERLREGEGTRERKGG